MRITDFHKKMNYFGIYFVMHECFHTLVEKIGPDNAQNVYI